MSYPSAVCRSWVGPAERTGPPGGRPGLRRTGAPGRFAEPHRGTHGGRTGRSTISAHFNASYIVQITLHGY